MRVLVDTSIWIDHFHQSDPGLRSLLLDDSVVLADAVVGELIAGNLPKRTRTISDLLTLPRLETPPANEVFEWIERQKLGGKGLSWVDCLLLATASRHLVPIWTRDKRLRSTAQAAGLAHPAK